MPNNLERLDERLFNNMRLVILTDNNIVCDKWWVHLFLNLREEAIE